MTLTLSFQLSFAQMLLLCILEIPGQYPDPIAGYPTVSYNVLQSVKGRFATVSQIRTCVFFTHTFPKLIFTNHCIIDGGGPGHVPGSQSTWALQWTLERPDSFLSRVTRPCPSSISNTHTHSSSNDVSDIYLQIRSLFELHTQKNIPRYTVQPTELIVQQNANKYRIKPDAACRHVGYVERYLLIRHSLGQLLP
jgi:hypothetical protein